VISTNSLVDRIKEEHPEFAEKFSSEKELKDYVSAHVEEFMEALGKADPAEAKEKFGPDTRREQLEQFQELGAHGVMTTSMRDQDTCNVCLDHDGTVYRMEEALDKEPLPHGVEEDENCKCYYEMLREEETFQKWKKSDPDLSNLYD
jgi:hypothetical protein